MYTNLSPSDSSLFSSYEIDSGFDFCLCCGAVNDECGTDCPGLHIGCETYNMVVSKAEGNGWPTEAVLLYWQGWRAEEGITGYFTITYPSDMYFWGNPDSHSEYVPQYEGGIEDWSRFVDLLYSASTLGEPLPCDITMDTIGPIIRALTEMGPNLSLD